MPESALLELQEIKTKQQKTPLKHALQLRSLLLSTFLIELAARIHVLGKDLT